MFREIISLLKHTMVYGLGNVLSRMVAFLLLPVLTNYLPPAEYGIYNLYYMMIGIAMEILRLGQDISLLRFYALEKAKTARKIIFSTVFWASTTVSVVLAAGIWFGAALIVKIVVELPEPYPDWSIYTLKLCALIVLLDNLTAFPLVVMRVDGQPIRFSTIKLVTAITQVAGTVVLVVYMRRGIAGIFEANLISSSLQMLLCLPTIIGRTKPIFDKAIFKACFWFGIPNVPNSLFVVGIGMADRKILELLRGAAEMGIYAAGYKLGMFLSIVAMGFRYAWQPFFLKHADREDAEEMYARVLTYYFAVTLWLYLLLTAFIPPLAKWNIPGTGYLIDPDYWEGLRIFPIVLLAYLFDGVYAIFMVGVYLKKKLHALPFITGAAVVLNVFGNIMLVPTYGMWASAWLTVASYALMALLLYVYIQRYYPVRYEWGRLLHVTAVAGLCYASGEYGIRSGLWYAAYISSVAFPLILLSTKFGYRQELTRIGISKKEK